MLMCLIILRLEIFIDFILALVILALVYCALIFLYFVILDCVWGIYLWKFLRT